MGEYADMLIDGTIDERGEIIDGESPGYERSRHDAGDDFLGRLRSAVTHRGFSLRKCHNTHFQVCDEQGPNPGFKDQAKCWASPAGRDYRSPNAESYQDRSDSTKDEQLVNQVEHQFLPPDQRQTGDESRKCSTRRLNPAFVCWLMGVPWFWTRAEPISSAAVETAAYRSLLLLHLSSLLGGQD